MVFIGICFLYCFFLLFLLYGIGKIKTGKGSGSLDTTRFSIVVPFRNEAENLPRLLESFTGLDYPRELFEVLLVDDDSRDSSSAICEEFQKRHHELKIQVLSSIRKTASPKKDAIGTGIGEALFDFIVTADADCKVPPLWLSTFERRIRTEGAKMLVGPVSLSVPGSSDKKSFLDRFQELDFLSLQAATMGGFGIDKPFLCNGANLCFEKNSFIEVEGYKGNSHISSGDDVFLLEKFERAGLKSVYVKEKEAIVVTKPQPSWERLVSQRVRWAAKTSSYKDYFGKWIGLLVLLMNLALAVGCLFVILGLLPGRSFLIVFLIKFNVDFLLVYRSAAFFSCESSLRSYLWCSALYPFFSTYVAVKSFFTGYIWKERYFKK